MSGLGLGVEDLELRVAEVHVANVEVASLGDAQAGAGENQDEDGVGLRAASVEPETGLSPLGLLVVVDRGRLGDSRPPRDGLPRQAVLVAQADDQLGSRGDVRALALKRPGRPGC